MTTRDVWQQLGRSNALWAVLSTPEARDGSWDVPEFLATGRIHVEHVRGLLATSGAELGDHVLDFGCGVGRLTFALAAHAQRVTGIDVASSMIEHAERLNGQPDRVRFVHYDGGALPFDDDSFDSAVSLIVLQHMPPRTTVPYLIDLLRVVRPGGTLVLQIPSHPLVPDPLSQGAYRAGLEFLTWPTELAAGQAATVRALVTNTSEQRWPVGQCIRLANHWLREGDIAVRDDGRTELPHAVEPGETIELALGVTAPPESGVFDLELDLVHEFVTWWSDLGSPTARVPVTVVGRPDAATPISGPDSSGPDSGAPDADASESEGTVPAAPSVSDAAIEMHPLHVTLVRSLFDHLDAYVLAVVEDDLAAVGWCSYTYVVRVGDESS